MFLYCESVGTLHIHVKYVLVDITLFYLSIITLTLCSRLSNLSLEILEEYNFSTPQFYRNLQKLTDNFCNRYEAPTDRRPGLKMLHPSPGGREITQPGGTPNNHWDVPHAHWTDKRALDFTTDPATQDQPGSVPSKSVHTDITGDNSTDVHTGIDGNDHAITGDVHEEITE